MDPVQLLAFLRRIETLKTNPRHAYTAGGVRETVAAHSWRTALLAMLLASEFPELDMNKVIRMCLIHDLGEAVTGDIPAFEKTDEHRSQERLALAQLVDTAPAADAAQMHALFAEMDALGTPEARLYKALDRIEAVIQHNESDIATWIPLEYQLQQTYGWENLEEFPAMLALRRQVLADTQEKIRAAGGEPETQQDQ
ncbi:phosphohydrolase [Gemmiger sp. An120]|uniref:HD domain-containing protein n=1 Tax=Gemmiger TaxID=204475 RepID=UPI000B3A4115|nr:MULTISPECIES: HD domain-containing protein [Gemmiger]MBM6915456.1 HD domain-containing protein [Gemmiger formicilis]OUQ44376.1 phosphohydrolase [Gemmiger sp. An120]HIX34577.1 HD domain-containing protein [Candidatus Gemmiger avium]